MHLSPPRSRRPSASNKAYEALLRGRYELSQSDYASAERWGATAVALDPGSADAWALRADVNSWQSASELRPNGGEHLAQRRDYVNNALSIDPTNALALGVRALMDTHYVNRDYQAAVNELVRLVTLHPNNEELLLKLSYVLTTIGRADMVDRVTAHAVQLAPLSSRALTGRIAGLFMFGSVEEVRQAMGEFTGLGFQRSVLSAQLALAERDTAALQEIIPQENWGSPVYAVYSALVPYLNGDLERAREVIAPLKHAEGYQSFRTQAFVALLEQDTDAALANYREAIRSAEQQAIMGAQGIIGWRQAFPEFYADPRHSQMLKDFKLDPVSTAKIHVPELPF